MTFKIKRIADLSDKCLCGHVLVDAGLQAPAVFDPYPTSVLVDPFLIRQQNILSSLLSGIRVRFLLEEAVKCKVCYPLFWSLFNVDLIAKIIIGDIIIHLPVTERHWTFYFLIHLFPSCLSSSADFSPALLTER